MKTRSNPSHAVTAIINARVHAMGGVIEPGVVLVVGELIAAVGEGESVALPTNARLIDAQRASITPGIIDLARFEQEDDRPEAEGVTAYVRAVPVHGPRGLSDAARAAANLHRAASAAQALGLHLLGPWLPGFGHPPPWPRLWEATNGAIRLITLSARGGAKPHLVERVMTVGARPIIPADDPLLDSAPPEETAIRGLSDRSPPPRHPLIFTVDDPPARLAAARPASLPNPVLISSSSGRNLAATDVLALMTAWKTDFNAVLPALTSGPADLLGLPLGRLAPNAPADLVCWSEPGRVQWVMIAGRVVFPAPEKSAYPPPNPARTRFAEGGFIYTMSESSATGRRGVEMVTRFLLNRPETLALRNVESDPRYQKKDIDLIWRWRDAQGREWETSIEVKGDAWSAAKNFFFETVSNADKNTPGCFLATQADWYFYVFVDSGMLYCLPMLETRAWFLKNRARFRRVETRTAVRGDSYRTIGRLVPIVEVMAAIPRARRLKLAPPIKAHSRRRGRSSVDSDEKRG